MMTFCALSLARYVRTRSTAWGIGFFGALAFIVLLNSTFQWFWLAATAGPLVVLMRHRWRSFLAVAAVPLLFVAVWYVKDAVLFGTNATSSWFGMNLAKTTTYRASPVQLGNLLGDCCSSRHPADFDGEMG
jgi:hypothetical protein